MNLTTDYLNAKDRAYIENRRIELKTRKRKSIAPSPEARRNNARLVRLRWEIAKIKAENTGMRVTRGAKLI